MATLLRLVNWNIERQPPSSWKAKLMLERVAALAPDLVCLTEAYQGSTASLGGYEISVPGIAWSREKPGERKVVLWSRHPWIRTEGELPPQLASGAFIAGQTQTALGSVCLVGLCIPYNFASPYGQTPRARPWSEHMRFLEGLDAWMKQQPGDRTMIVAGDYNQFVPRVWGTKAAGAALSAALKSLTICTGGPVSGIGRPTVDHIATSADLTAERVSGIDEHDEHGRELSDHFGVVIDLQRLAGDYR